MLQDNHKEILLNGINNEILIRKSISLPASIYKLRINGDTDTIREPHSSKRVTNVWFGFNEK